MWIRIGVFFSKKMLFWRAALCHHFSRAPSRRATIIIHPSAIRRSSFPVCPMYSNDTTARPRLLRYPGMKRCVAAAPVFFTFTARHFGDLRQ
jgi:hypothetical protein